MSMIGSAACAAAAPSPCTARPTSARLEPARNVRRDTSRAGIMGPPQTEILAHPARSEERYIAVRENPRDRLHLRRRRGDRLRLSELAGQPAVAAGCAEDVERVAAALAGGGAADVLHAPR